jgi:hypothetical protein
MTPFANWRTLAFGAAALAVGFGATKAALVKADPPARKGGVDNAMLQARRLMTELQSTGWDNYFVDKDLRRLPEQDFAAIPSRRAPEADSFVIARTFDEYDEIAFTCDTFVERPPSGSGGVSGFFIVGWKTGAINTYDVSDVRMYQLQDRDALIFVFPGMDEYSPDLPPMFGYQASDD